MLLTWCVRVYGMQYLTWRDIFECSDVNALHGVILDRKCAIDRLHGCSVNPGDRAL